jgi:flagellar FliL protein
MARSKEPTKDQEPADPADLEANPEPKPVVTPGPAPRSLAKTAVAMALTTILAAVTGGLYGIQITSTVKDAIDARAKADEPRVTSRYGGDTNLKDLTPIITNLAEPRETWIRLEASLVFDAKAVPIPDVLTGEISGDILAYLRTVTLTQIEGASGLRQLREDLNERVAIRSEGRVRELIIQTLVVQ